MSARAPSTHTSPPPLTTAATFTSPAEPSTKAVPIQLLRCHSTDLLTVAPPPAVTTSAPPSLPPNPPTLPGPAELVLGELLDTGLLGEGLISSMRDAKARLTSRDFVSIPASAVVYAVRWLECGWGGGA